MRGSRKGAKAGAAAAAATAPMPMPAATAAASNGAPSPKASPSKSDVSARSPTAKAGKSGDSAAKEEGTATSPTVAPAVSKKAAKAEKSEQAPAASEKDDPRPPERSAPAAVPEGKSKRGNEKKQRVAAAKSDGAAAAPVESKAAAAGSAPDVPAPAPKGKGRAPAPAATLAAEGGSPTKGAKASEVSPAAGEVPQGAAGAKVRGGRGRGGGGVEAPNQAAAPEAAAPAPAPTPAPAPAAKGGRAPKAPATPAAPPAAPPSAVTAAAPPAAPTARSGGRKPAAAEAASATGPAPAPAVAAPSARGRGADSTKAPTMPVAAPPAPRPAAAGRRTGGGAEAAARHTGGGAEEGRGAGGNGGVSGGASSYNRRGVPERSEYTSAPSRTSDGTFVDRVSIPTDLESWADSEAGEACAEQVRAGADCLEVKYTRARAGLALFEVRGVSKDDVRRGVALLDMHLSNNAMLVSLTKEKTRMRSNLQEVERELNSGLRVEMEVAPDVLGLIIGKAGGHIRKIEEEFDVQVTVDSKAVPPVVRIKGSHADDVEEARRRVAFTVDRIPLTAQQKTWLFQSKDGRTLADIEARSKVLRLDFVERGPGGGGELVVTGLQGA